MLRLDDPVHLGNAGALRNAGASSREVVATATRPRTRSAHPPDAARSGGLEANDPRNAIRGIGLVGRVPKEVVVGDVVADTATGNLTVTTSELADGKAVFVTTGAAATEITGDATNASQAEVEMLRN